MVHIRFLFMLMMLVCWLEAYTKMKNTEGLLVASSKIARSKI